MNWEALRQLVKQEQPVLWRRVQPEPWFRLVCALLWEA